MGGYYSKEVIKYAPRMTRKEVIKSLVAFETLRIIGDLNEQDFDSLEDMIENGVAGFANLTDEELAEEYDNCYNAPIKIISIDSNGNII
jgi:hypothetical protein